MERWRDDMEENEPDFIHDTPPRDDLHLGKLQGQFVSLDTCNTAVNLSEGIVKLIDDTAKEKDQPPLVVDGQAMETSHEPCQHHERNVAVNGVGKAMDKHMRRTLEVNNVSLDSQLRVNLNLSDLCREARKEFSLIALHQKGKGELFKEFME